jgi:hypothetical protein
MPSRHTHHHQHHAPDLDRDKAGMGEKPPLLGLTGRAEARGPCPPLRRLRRTCIFKSEPTGPRKRLATSAWSSLGGDGDDGEEP